jgi:hypothetical protein
MSDNSWYENGELPPVGTKCEVTHNGISGIWEEIEILKHDINYKGSGSSGRLACISLSGINVGRSRKEGDLFWLHNVKDEDCKFRPIKTEREMAIDDMLKIAYTPEVINNRTIMGALYDAGYRKNES